MKYLFLLLLVSGCSYNRTNCPHSSEANWESYPIKVKIDNSISLDRKNATLYSMSLWNNAINENVFTEVSSQEDIYITEVSNWQLDQLQEAHALLWWQNGLFTNGLIEVNIKNYLYDTGDIVARNKLSYESLILHELGHIIGMYHVDDTIMDPYLSTGKIRLTIDSDIISSVQCRVRASNLIKNIH
jgi:predicted Zn-dependent protease